MKNKSLLTVAPHQFLIVLLLLTPGRCVPPPAHEVYPLPHFLEHLVEFQLGYLVQRSDLAVLKDLVDQHK